MKRATLYTFANILLYATSFLGQAAPTTVAGTLDTSFNPSGFSISSTGASVDFGGYAGSLIIDFGGRANGRSVNTFDFTDHGERILFCGNSNTGGLFDNFALTVLTSTGVLDRSFNPSGLSISSTGVAVDLAGYAGSLIIDLGGSDGARSVQAFNFENQGERIILGGVTTTGPVGSLQNFALVVLTSTGLLDSFFNPSGLTIQADGSSSKITGLGYAGALIIDLGGFDRAFTAKAVMTDQGDRILLGGVTNTGLNPLNIALVALTPTGLLDSSFNPSGLTINSDGSSSKITGLGYTGALIIDLGGSDIAYSVDSFNCIAQENQIILGGLTSSGLNSPNIMLVALTQTGLLNQLFNPSGFSISATGASVDLGGYAGSLIIDLGGNDRATSVDSFAIASCSNRITLGGFTSTGPIGSSTNFALVALTPTGLLDHSFNPSGFTITSTGALIDLGGYAGSLIIDIGGIDLGTSIDSFDITFQDHRIILGGYTTTGPNPFNFALVAFTSTGLLDSSFNPSGLTVQADGSSTKLSGLGYAGSLIIDLGGNDYAYSTDAFSLAVQGERILLGGFTNTGPSNPDNSFALVAVHGSTRFPPQPIAVNPLAKLPFIVIAAA